MAIAIEQARSTALLAAAKVEAEDRRERRRAISAAKVMAGQSGRYVGEQAVQLHGGMGMTDELAVGWYFKRLVAHRLTYGDADHHLELYGEAAVSEVKEDLVLVRREGAIAVMTLNNPRRMNAFSLAMRTQMWERAAGARVGRSRVAQSC